MKNKKAEGHPVLYIFRKDRERLGLNKQRHFRMSSGLAKDHEPAPEWYINGGPDALFCISGSELYEVTPEQYAAAVCLE